VVIINTKYLLMYLTVLSHFNMRQVNTLGDICNENILLMSKSNIRTETFLIVITYNGMTLESQMSYTVRGNMQYVTVL